MKNKRVYNFMDNRKKYLVKQTVAITQKIRYNREKTNWKVVKERYVCFPTFVDESAKEIERMNGLGVKLIGELVPYIDKWEGYAGETCTPF